MDSKNVNNICWWWIIIFAKLSIFFSKLLLQFESLEEFLLQQSSRTRNVKAAVVISSKPRTTDTQRELFSRFWNFWAWAEKMGWNFMRHLGYFWPNYKHYFGTVSPLSMGKCSWFFFLQKTLVFRSKTYNSQIQCTLDLVTHLVCQKTVTKSRGVTK